MPLRYLRLTWQALTAGGPFVGVEAHPLFPAGLIGLLAARIRRRPLVVVAHGSDVRMTAVKNRLYGLLARQVVRGADAVVANSTDSAERVAALGGRAIIIPPGVDAALFHPTAKPGERRVLYLGGSEANKGYETARRHADTLAGPGLRALSPQEVASTMAAHDVVLVPSHAEGYGLVAAEAIAAGRWVVARRVGGLIEVVEDGVTGTLVDEEVGFGPAIANVPDYDPYVVAARSRAPTLDQTRSAMADVWTRILAARARGRASLDP